MKMDKQCILFAEPVVIWESHTPRAVEYPWKFILGGKNISDYNGVGFVVHDSVGHEVFRRIIVKLVSMPCTFITCEEVHIAIVFLPLS